MTYQETMNPVDQPVIERLPQTSPADAFNQELVRNVHPSDWVNPKPAGRYNLVVIGAGTAGLVTAVGAAGLGARVALIERSLMGGDCLNVGCVPSKGVISAARVAAAVRNAREFGVEVPDGMNVNFAAAMQRMRRLRASISLNDSASRFRDLGIDVYFGQARFVDSSTVNVDGSHLHFKRAVIATGARAAAPPIPGLDAVDYLTNETLFSLTELPARFGVIGAGPIGCEMAQAFAQLGSEVFLVEATHGILPREDRDAAGIVQQAITRSGVKLLCCGKKLEIKHDGGIRLVVESHGQGYDEPIDKLLVAVGRAPNVENLNLEDVGVDYDNKGVKVNERMQTTNSRIYAAGDICSPFQFTHAADFMARIVIQNALFKGRKKSTSLVMPWCTYTSPEIAHVGLYEHQAQEQGIEVDTFVQAFSDVDRAILDGEDEGFVKIHVRKGTDKIIGATLVAGHAGDMISEITLAMTHGLGLKQIGSTIHPYPTQAEAIRKLGDQFNRTRMTPLVKWLFNKWLARTR
ncbi:mercuric reductase [Methylomarinum sp. Ch1-1]|uniref:Mercuric reductase n=1 Tax=Methylomarinum roseum TaxID=3067653 RepID=A0AAU7NR09_9GAMM|nr:mercuric reductase [Methylomarinum sp. Ch1-1]MDP4520664.1 mercuric reductase [Methylomarinum sp. Ch1-1]